ncbi:MAG TPA: sigma-70 family RNA polymerase sigma factor [Acidobacteriota bacterium]|nr:sigma-70 family RNA polymerase sigma factor [Acidobacteriota bacterium]HRR55756.1 sigma-70 family RNA polymerase sigma factor [Acidobacteriota bacterium]HRV08094.1 sigma-70 family RNA polymerase sigma factor [Acidobacteriota bacterium]
MSEQARSRKERKDRRRSDGAPRKEEIRDLVTGARRGSVDDFRRLYEVYGRKILNYLYRMTGSREEAEDLAQDTFILAYTKLDTLKDPDRFQSWLYRIAQNNVYQRYRGRKPVTESIDQADEDSLSELQKLASPEHGPEEQVLSEELEQVIQEAIRELPEKYRTVFVLSAIQRLSYAEIAEILRRSLPAVKSDIHRARVAVRDKVKRYLGVTDEMPKVH